MNPLSKPVSKFFRDAAHDSVGNDDNQEELTPVIRAVMKSVLAHPQNAIPINVQIHRVLCISKKKCTII